MKETFNRHLVGIDGFKYGWVGVSLKSGSAELFKNLADLINFYQENSLFMIDMPIGLASDRQLERNCEIIARKLLSCKRKSSLFFGAVSEIRLLYHMLRRIK